MSIILLYLKQHIFTKLAPRWLQFISQNVLALSLCLDIVFFLPFSSPSSKASRNTVLTNIAKKVGKARQVTGDR